MSVLLAQVDLWFEIKTWLLLYILLIIMCNECLAIIYKNYAYFVVLPRYEK